MKSVALLPIALWGCGKETSAEQAAAHVPFQVAGSVETVPMTGSAPDVVAGDGFTFEVPGDFKPVDPPTATTAYTGTIDGPKARAKVTLWATSEPFAGDLAALTARESEAAMHDGASPPDAAPVIAHVGAEIVPGYATRLTIKSADRIELRTLVVHEGKAYIHHCATPNVANAWANVGLDCITRGTTFHVAPPRAP